MKILILKVFIMLIFLCGTVSGTTYYIDQNDSIASDTLPGTIDQPWKTIHKANITLVAGDTVYLRAGNYVVGNTTSTEGIKPSNSGSSGNPIVYTIYGDEVVNLIGQADSDITSRGIWINAKSYIVVDGKSLGQLNLSKMTSNLILGPWQDPIGNTTYNEIAYIYCYNSFDNDNWSHAWQGSIVSESSIYNHIHHCKFQKHGLMGTEVASSEGNLFDLGIEYTTEESDRVYYNVIENNEFLHGGHATFGWLGDHNVIRNNYFHNEGWYNINGKLYGYRNIIGDGVPDYVGNNLFEGNRIGHAAPNHTWPGKTVYWGGTGMKLCHPYNIIRFNSFFNNASGAIDLATYAAPYNAKGAYNRIYNNTFFHNGWYPKIPQEDSTYLDVIVFAYTGSGDWSVIYDNVFKNNLFYNNANTRSESYDVWHCSGGSTLADIIDPEKGNCTIENNMNDSAGENTNPLFTDTTLSNTSSWTLPNLNLSAGSPAIDQGTYLTQANGSGSGTTTLVVDDARYFQDGNFGKGTLAWPSSVKIYADWIAIGTCENIVQIKSIDYSTNTITLESPMTWSDEDRIWLYRNSNGAVVLHGSAPDIGAYEHGQGGVTPTPLNLQPNYPNPFNTTTTINYSVNQAGNVKLIIYDKLGREIKVLVNKYKTVGPQSVQWDGTDSKGARTPSGIYFYQLKTSGGFVGTKKMVFLK